MFIVTSTVDRAEIFFNVTWKLTNISTMHTSCYTCLTESELFVHLMNSYIYTLKRRHKNFMHFQDFNVSYLFTLNFVPACFDRKDHIHETINHKYGRTKGFTV
jgi:predicted phosphoadenosine phosphosulfate sulfurtransferase